MQISVCNSWSSLQSLRLFSFPKRLLLSQPVCSDDETKHIVLSSQPVSTQRFSLFLLYIIICNLQSEFFWFCFLEFWYLFFYLSFFYDFMNARNCIEELGELKSFNPLTKRRMLLTSCFMYLCYHPSRYLSGLHNSALCLFDFNCLFT